jgi:O-methyltransferase
MRLSARARSVLAERLTYLTPERFLRIEGAARKTLHVPGDIVEFGVALGGSAIVLASHANSNKRFYGLDVFDMIPEPSSEKDDAKSKARYEIIKSGQSEGLGGAPYYGYRKDLLEDVKASFAKHGLAVDGDRIQLHKGLFHDTFPAIGVDEVALAHVDCDWYDPVAYCLAQLSNRMSSGGLIVIDDYNDYGGCRTAVDEFLRANPSFRFEPGPNPILRRI